MNTDLGIDANSIPHIVDSYYGSGYIQNNSRPSISSLVCGISAIVMFKLVQPGSTKWPQRHCMLSWYFLSPNVFLSVWGQLWAWRSLHQGQGQILETFYFNISLTRRHLSKLLMRPGYKLGRDHKQGKFYVGSCIGKQEVCLQLKGILFQNANGLIYNYAWKLIGMITAELSAVHNSLVAFDKNCEEVYANDWSCWGQTEHLYFTFDWVDNPSFRLADKSL